MALKWSSKGLQIPVVVLLVLGFFFRLVDLDLKPYWHDEIFTLLRVSGYQAAEAVQHLFTGQVMGIDQLLQYQSPAADKGAWGTIYGLATEEPQHPPLYYLTARYWAEWLGSSVATTRLLPALLSLLGFPAIYWLCLELFALPAVGVMAMVLYAVSPIYIRYAQEARQYSLWLVLVMVASAMLLRALRQPSRLNWSLYTLTVIAGLYCHMLSGVVFVGHGLYVLAIERRLSRNLIAYLSASLLGFLAFIPWLWIAWTNHTMLASTTDWMKNQLPLTTLLQFWSLNLCRVFVAWDASLNFLIVPVTVLILLLVLYALYWLCRSTPARVWLFVLILIGTMLATLVLPDLLLGGRRSSIDRYFLPLYLGVHLAVAYLLTTKSMTLSSVRTAQVWRVLTAVLLSVSVVSCAVSASAKTWWGWSEFDVEIPKIINQTQRPLVISDMAIGNVMPLSHRLKSDAEFLLIRDPSQLQIPSGFSSVFAYNPSPELAAAIQKQQPQHLNYQFQDRLTGLRIALYQNNP